MNSKNLGYKHLFQVSDEKKKESTNEPKTFPECNISFEYKNASKAIQIVAGDRMSIPFPPYEISSSYQIFLSIISIFSPLIGNKSYLEIQEKSLLEWIYFYKINYPHMPNIYDLMLILNLNPEEVLDSPNSGTFRIIIHQFCSVFSAQSNIKIKDFSMAIPSDGVLKKFDDDMIVFVPMISPISPYMHQNDNDSTNTITNPNNKPVYFKFPTTLTAKYTEEKYQIEPAFAPIENNNANDNNDNNDNNNNSNSVSDNSNTKPPPPITYEKKYNFYGGMFESHSGPSKYILVKINKNYYKYYTTPDVHDYQNRVEMINESSNDEVKESLYKDYCVAAFFLKEKSIEPYMYQHY